MCGLRKGDKLKIPLDNSKRSAVEQFLSFRGIKREYAKRCKTLDIERSDGEYKVTCDQLSFVVHDNENEKLRMLYPLLLLQLNCPFCRVHQWQKLVDGQGLWFVRTNGAFTCIAGKSYSLRYFTLFSYVDCVKQRAKWVEVSDLPEGFLDVYSVAKTPYIGQPLLSQFVEFAKEVNELKRHRLLFISASVFCVKHTLGFSCTFSPFTPVLFVSRYNVYGTEYFVKFGGRFLQDYIVSNVYLYTKLLEAGVIYKVSNRFVLPVTEYDNYAVVLTFLRKEEAEAYKRLVQAYAFQDISRPGKFVLPSFKCKKSTATKIPYFEEIPARLVNLYSCDDGEFLELDGYGVYFVSQ